MGGAVSDAFPPPSTSPGGGPTRLELDALPGAVGPLLRGALARKPGLRVLEGSVPSLPELEISVRGAVSPTDRLAAYEGVCALPVGEHLPPTWPSVLAGSLKGSLLAHPDFPLRLMGLIHTASRFTEHRPLGRAEPLDLRCRVGDTRPHRLGFEFSLQMEVSVGGELAWEEDMVILHRVASMAKRARAEGGASKARSERPPPPLGEPGGALRSTILRLPADLGRRYAKVSGDWNPIHLWPLTARAFGFRRPIIHGMWSLARCLAELGDDLPPFPRATAVRFKKPIFLPGRAALRAGHAPPGDAAPPSLAFRLAKVDGSKIYVSGEVAPL